MPFQELTRAEFDSFMKQTERGHPVLVHWNPCHPCKVVLPLFMDASQYCGTTFLSIEREQAVMKPSIMKSMKVTGFPTILWVDPRRTECLEYEGPQTANDIAAWVNTLAAEN